MLFRASVRNFGSYQSLVALHAAVGPDQRAGLRWYEIRNPAQVAATIRQSGTYFGPPENSDSRWAGSIAQDGVGDIALGFSVVGETLPPSIGYAGRSAADPLGIFTTGDGRLFTGRGVQKSALGRWGDYSSLTVDPVDECTFWYTQEYYPESAPFDWHTRIGSFRFDSCGAVPTISDGDGEGQVLTASTGDWSALPGASFSYQWRRCDAPGESCEDITGATNRTYTIGGDDVDRTLRVLVRASTGTAEASALSKPTPLITPTPAVGPLDLTASIAAAPPVSVQPGGDVTYTIEVGNATLTGSATDVVLTVKLPAGAEWISSDSDRGTDCTGTIDVVCRLDFIPGGRKATVVITARLKTRGTQTAFATVRAQQTLTDPAAAQASVTVTVQGKPKLALTTPVRTERTAGALTVSVTLSLDEPATVTVRALGRSGKSLTLLPGSAAGRIVLHRPASAITVRAVAGRLRLALRLAPGTNHGRLVIRASDRDGETAGLTLPFQA